MNAKIISIANHKGGVGKTTSTASLGEALALAGFRVLLIDLDAQQNLTYTLARIDEPERSVYDTLVRDSALPVMHIRRNLDLVPASLELARAEIDMATKIAREGILKTHLNRIDRNYDFVLLDCPPSLGIVTTNAFVASTKIYIPLTAEALPMKGLSMLDDVIGEVKSRINPNLELGGIFITRYNNRNLNKDVLAVIKDKYKDKICFQKIRENIALAEMPLIGKSIFEYDPKSNGANDYKALAKEILNREMEN